MKSLTIFVDSKNLQTWTVGLPDFDTSGEESITELETPGGKDKYLVLYDAGFIDEQHLEIFCDLFVEALSLSDCRLERVYLS